MRKIMVVLCILGLVAVAASPAGATPVTVINITVDGTWYPSEFNFDETDWDGYWGYEYTFTVTGTPAILKVTDIGLSGDQFAVYDQSILIGNTSVPQSQGEDIGGNYDAAFLDPRWSSGSFAMSLGFHRITGFVLTDLHNYGNLGVKVDPQPVAIVSTLFLFGTGLISLLLLGLRRRLSWQNLRMTPFTRQNPLSAPLCANMKANKFSFGGDSP